MFNSGTLAMIFRALPAMAFLLYSAVVSSETHPEVQAALDWKMPANDCSKPDLSLENETAPSRIGTSGPQERVGDSDAFRNTTISRPDIHNTYQARARRDRKKTRWLKCEKNYGQSLETAFDKLKSSAQFGLTRDQAEAILKKMADIQQVLNERYSPES